MKRSMHEAIVGELGGPRAAYLDDTGHMSGVDSLLALDRASRGGELARRRPRAAARGRHRLHLGRVGDPMVIEDLLGQELVSEWRVVAQERIDEFARATDDAQWIHTDPEARRRRAVRDDDRARLPDALARRAAVRRGAAAARGLWHDAQLRAQPRPFHGAGAVRAPDSRPLPGRGRRGGARSGSRRASPRRSSSRARRSRPASPRRSSVSSPSRTARDARGLLQSLSQGA